MPNYFYNLNRDDAQSKINDDGNETYEMRIETRHRKTKNAFIRKNRA